MERIDAGQKLDSYIYSVESAMIDPEKLKGKISSEDEETIE